MTRRIDEPSHFPTAQDAPPGAGLPALTMFGDADAPVCADGWCDLGTPAEGAADDDGASADGD